MKLAYALVADSAQVAADGKISMLGGDFDTINAPAFPTQLSNLALIIRINFEPDECEREHSLHIRLIGPLKNLALPPIANKFTPRIPPGFKEGEIRSAFVTNFSGLLFETAGSYQFQIGVDDKTLGEVLLHLVRMSV